MKYIYNDEHVVSYSDMDCNLKFSAISALTIVQDMMTSYYKHIGSDNLTIREKNNALWVLTRTKLKFYKELSWKDKISGTTYTTKVKPIRMEMETNFVDENDEMVFLASQELCPIDMSTRRIKKINDVEFPNDMECIEAEYEGESLNLHVNFDESNKVYEHKVMFADLDLSGHTNNVSYVKYLFNTLGAEFMREYVVDTFEIQYIHESVENDILSVYKKMCGDEIYFLIKCGEKEVVRAGAKVRK